MRTSMLVLWYCNGFCVDFWAKAKDSFDIRILLWHACRFFSFFFAFYSHFQYNFPDDEEA